MFRWVFTAVMAITLSVPAFATHKGEPGPLPPPPPQVEHQGYFVCTARNARDVEFTGIASREIDAQNVALNKCLARSMRCLPLGCQYLP